MHDMMENDFVQAFEEIRVTMRGNCNDGRWKSGRLLCV